MALEPSLGTILADVDIISDIDTLINNLPATFDANLFLRVRANTGSQYYWAERIGVAQKTVSWWERGISSPNANYRRRIKVALEAERQELSELLVKEDSLIDPFQTRVALDKSILRAALTDFTFDRHNEQIVAIPFLKDISFGHVEEIAKDIENLLNSLATQAQNLIEDLGSGQNVESWGLIANLSRYRDYCGASLPNPRLIGRTGQTLSTRFNDEDFRLAISNWNETSVSGFLQDHMELMRLYFREALARAQEIDAAEVGDSIPAGAGDNFAQIADQIESLHDDSGSPVVDPSISTVLRDIAGEMQDIDESISFATDSRRISFLTRRRVEAFKTGSIYVGRFVFFAALATAVLVPVGQGIIGSLAAILGLVEVARPGTLRKQYEGLREKFPILPSLPTNDERA